MVKKQYTRPAVVGSVPSAIAWLVTELGGLSIFRKFPALRCDTCGMNGTMGDGEFVRDRHAPWAPYVIYWHDPCVYGDLVDGSWKVYGRAEEV